jgi:hypothetical protein
MDLADGDGGTWGEEGDDWIWDLEERYDLGAADETVPTHVAAAA